MGRRFEQEIALQQRSRDSLAYRRAIEIAEVAAKRGYQIDKSIANESFAAMINDAVSKAVGTALARHHQRRVGFDRARRTS